MTNGSRFTLTLAVLGATLAAAPAALAAPTAPAGFTVTTFATAPAGTPAVTGADDIAYLDGNVFVGWQNGVGTMGEANPLTGQTTSTVVEYNSSGAQLQSWSLTGKVDGLGGGDNRVIATVNEDGNSSLYTITPEHPAALQVVHYTYSPAPDAAATGGLATGGGTDAVQVIDGKILISASNPGSASATAAFVARLDWRTGVATLTPTFADNAVAKDAITGAPVTLALTDPDSNAAVPESSARFGGDFALVSQADQEIVFARRPGRHDSSLTRLAMTYGGTPAGIDDLRFAGRAGGTLLVVDNAASTIYAVTGPFTAGEAFGGLDTIGAATKHGEVDTLDVLTGALTPFATGFGTPKGLLWIPGKKHGDGGHEDHGSGGGDQQSGGDQQGGHGD
jgi:hypothetical protein